ncbi:MAG: hypothetical protein IT312_11270 [Anaerolineales bacterium]|nr:hypothetical protein [Anaerolineales bacterium]
MQLHRAEATVPLLLIGANLPLSDTSYSASHANILPTLLDLMGVPSEARLRTYAPSLLTATAELNAPRIFLDGRLLPVEFPEP